MTQPDLLEVTGVRTPEEKGITPTFVQLKSVRRHNDPRAAVAAVPESGRRIG